MPASKNPESKPLTDREWVFVQEYLSGASIRSACATARFGKSTRNVILDRPHVRAAIERGQAQIANRVQRKVDITVDKVLGDLERQMHGAEGMGQFNAAIHASELQGRHIGMFREDYADREQAPMIVINNIIEGPGGVRTVVRVAPSPDLPMIAAPIHDSPMETLTDANLIWEK